MARGRRKAQLTSSEVIPVADFRTVLREFLRHAERSARRCALTPQRYLLLLMVKGAPDGSEHATVTDLARRLHLAQSTVTELCTRAEEAGLLIRESAANDARLAYIRLTDEGERRLACAFTANEEERRLLRDAIARLDGPADVESRG